jgi:hypothetical protein
MRETALLRQLLKGWRQSYRVANAASLTPTRYLNPARTDLDAVLGAHLAAAAAGLAVMVILPGRGITCESSPILAQIK